MKLDLLFLTENSKNDVGCWLFIIFIHAIKDFKNTQNCRSSSFEGGLKKVLGVPTKTFSCSVNASFNQGN